MKEFSGQLRTSVKTSAYRLYPIFWRGFIRVSTTLSRRSKQLSFPPVVNEHIVHIAGLTFRKNVSFYTPRLKFPSNILPKKHVHKMLRIMALSTEISQDGVK